MSTINREAAIAELMKMPKPFIHWEQVKKMLEAMPEEKTQLSGEDATFDSISRKLLKTFTPKGLTAEEWDAFVNDLPSAQPESEHTMEEFMYGQDLGSPEDGSL